jgi:hypothetical protein
MLFTPTFRLVWLAAKFRKPQQNLI